MSFIDLSDFPRSVRGAVLVLGVVALIAATTVGAYAGGSAKASEIAETKDVTIKQDIATHKDHDDERFADLKDRLSRMEGKLDRLIERGR